MEYEDLSPNSFDPHVLELEFSLSFAVFIIDFDDF